jgi:hypothetical protein
MYLPIAVPRLLTQHKAADRGDWLFVRLLLPNNGKGKGRATCFLRRPRGANPWNY